ncbi:MAG: peptidylprolyl isomerase, partial [Planctomycetota bacterium]
AVRAAEVGSVSAPVPTVAGFHLIRVESRTVTSFETVRETLRATLLDEEPSMTERGELRARLFAAAKIETF